MVLCGHSTSSLAYTTLAVPNSSKFIRTAIDYRLILTCIFYCIIYITRESLILLSKYNFKKFIKVIYSRLFYRESFFSMCANLYSEWIFLLNFILIALTLPNIHNPGSLNELNVLYHNVEGFVNLRDKSPSPQLFFNKILDFQGHIFHERLEELI